MSEFTIFTTADGAIINNVEVEDADISNLIEAGEDYISGSYPDDTYYIVDPTGTKTPTLRADPTISWDVDFITGDSTDAATATGIPNPSTVRYGLSDSRGIKEQADAVITDGTVVLKSPGQGIILVTIDAGVSYLLHEQEISVAQP